MGMGRVLEEDADHVLWLANSMNKMVKYLPFVKRSLSFPTLGFSTISCTTLLKLTYKRGSLSLKSILSKTNTDKKKW